MKLSFTKERVFGAHVWGSASVDTTPILARDCERFFKQIEASANEGSIESHGQLIFKIKDTCYTIYRGSDKLYQCCVRAKPPYPRAESKAYARQVLSVDAERVTALLNFAIVDPADPIYVSTAYLQSILRTYITKVASPKKDITIFHGGFPDIAPIIIPLDTFMRITNISVNHNDNMYSVKTTAVLNDADIACFMNFVNHTCGCFYAGESAIDDITPAVMLMIREFDIRFVTVVRIRD